MERHFTGASEVGSAGQVLVVQGGLGRQCRWGAGGAAGRDTTDACSDFSWEAWRLSSALELSMKNRSPIRKPWGLGVCTRARVPLASSLTTSVGALSKMRCVYPTESGPDTSTRKSASRERSNAPSDSSSVSCAG